ncbi:Alginate lyase [Vibrio rarus]
MKKTALVLALTSAILSGCGGSSDGSNNTDNDNNTPPEDVLPQPPEDTSPLPPEDNSPLPPEESPEDGSFNWNIESWKLTIPASKDDWYNSGGEGAAEIMPDRCNDSKDVLTNEKPIYDAAYDIAYFSVEDGRMHFRADMGYGSTTENSNYIRSEFRELYISSDSSNCSSSNEDTSWYLDDIRTKVSTHELNATLKIEQHPDMDQPKVVLGQIHGWKISQALVKLLWEGDDRPVRVILNNDYELDNESCGSCYNFSVELGTYATGEEWSYTIRADEDGIYLATFDANGKNAVDHFLPWGENYKDKNGKTVKLSEDWTDPEIAFYFKAGIYPQFKPEYSSEIFDVSFRSLNIDHY